MDFKQKYLKYKKKYLDLKIQQGGVRFENKYDAYCFITANLTKKITITVNRYDYICSKSNSDVSKCPKNEETFVLNDFMKKKWKENGYFYVEHLEYPVIITIKNYN